MVELHAFCYGWCIGDLVKGMTLCLRLVRVQGPKFVRQV